jgi:hypothetical protein
MVDIVFHWESPTYHGVLSRDRHAAVFSITRAKKIFAGIRQKVNNAQFLMKSECVVPIPKPSSGRAFFARTARKNRFRTTATDFFTLASLMR